MAASVRTHFGGNEKLRECFGSAEWVIERLQPLDAGLESWLLRASSAIESAFTAKKRPLEHAASSSRCPEAAAAANCIELATSCAHNLGEKML